MASNTLVTGNRPSAPPLYPSDAPPPYPSHGFENVSHTFQIKETIPNGQVAGFVASPSPPPTRIHPTPNTSIVIAGTTYEKSALVVETAVDLLDLGGIKKIKQLESLTTEIGLNWKSHRTEIFVGTSISLDEKDPKISLADQSKILTNLLTLWRDDQHANFNALLDGMKTHKCTPKSDGKAYLLNCLTHPAKIQVMHLDEELRGVQSALQQSKNECEQFRAKMKEMEFNHSDDRTELSDARKALTEVISKKSDQEALMKNMMSEMESQKTQLAELKKANTSLTQQLSGIKLSNSEHKKTEARLREERNYLQIGASTFTRQMTGLQSQLSKEKEISKQMVTQVNASSNLVDELRKQVTELESKIRQLENEIEAEKFKSDHIYSTNETLGRQNQALANKYSVCKQKFKRSENSAFFDMIEATHK